MEEWAFNFSGAPESLRAPILFERRANALRRTQDELIDEVQQIAERWCARRRKAVEAMNDLGLASMQYSGPVRAAEFWMQFCRGAVQRLTEDAADQLHLSVAMAKTCGDGFIACQTEPGAARRPPSKAAPARTASRKRAKSRPPVRRRR